MRGDGVHRLLRHEPLADVPAAGDAARAERLAGRLEDEGSCGQGRGRLGRRHGAARARVRRGRRRAGPGRECAWLGSAGLRGRALGTVQEPSRNRLGTV